MMSEEPATKKAKTTDGLALIKQGAEGVRMLHATCHMPHARDIEIHYGYTLTYFIIHPMSLFFFFFLSFSGSIVQRSKVNRA